MQQSYSHPASVEGLRSAQCIYRRHTAASSANDLCDYLPVMWGLVVVQKRKELEAIAASPVASESPSDDSDYDSGRERKRSKKHKGSKGKRSKHKKEKSRSKKKHRASRKNEGSGVEVWLHSYI